MDLKELPSKQVVTFGLDDFAKADRSALVSILQDAVSPSLALCSGLMVHVRSYSLPNLRSSVLNMR
jgi:hypothetical protein